LLLSNDEYTLVSQKSVTTLSCYNFDTHESILIFFDRNVTEKVSIHKALTFPPHLTSICALSAGGRDTKLCLFTQMPYYCRLRPVTSLIYSVLLLATHAHAAV